ncbi:MAG: ankyrin repeat domain-containing protein, partial [Verrucomicrobium sp.]
MEIGLRLLLSPGQERSILANHHHEKALESLFHPEHGTFSIEHPRRKDPSQDVQVSIKADPSKPLPPHFDSLICAIAQVAPDLAAKMLSAPLLCQTEPVAKAGLAFICAKVWKEAGLPEPGQVLGKTEGAALRKEMLALLAGDKFTVELKQLWAPLVEHEAAQAPSHQADGSPSGQPMDSGNTVHGIAGQFYVALIHGDTVGMKIALQELSQLGDAGASEAYRNCHLDMMQVAPLPVPQIPLSEPSLSPLRDGITITSPTTETEPAPPAMREEVPFTQQEFAMVVPGSAASLELQKQNAEGPEKLAEAITSGNLEQMEKLLGESGALLINAKMPPSGFTPVGLAAALGNKEAVALFLKCPGVDVNQCSLLAPTVGAANAAARRGIVADASPLILGMKSGNMEVVELLLAAPGIDLNAVNRYGQTPLCQAARMGNVELVAHLLQQPQVDATLADVYGLTPLHAAAANLEQPTLVQAFLAFREDEFDSLANIPDPRGNKALDYARAVGNDPTDVIGSLELFTEPSSVHAAPSILTDYTQSFLLVGPEVPRFPLGNFQEV